jgi:hypothetical protein
MQLMSTDRKSYLTYLSKEMKRKIPLPADKKGPGREVRQSTRRRKEVTKRLEYQPQTSKGTRHRHCRGGQSEKNYDKAISDFCKVIMVKSVITPTGKKILNDALKNYCYSLFVKIMLPNISSTCKQGVRSIGISLVNGFFKVPVTKVDDILNATDAIMIAVQMRDKKESRNTTPSKTSPSRCR